MTFKSAQEHWQKYRLDRLGAEGLWLACSLPQKHDIPFNLTANTNQSVPAVCLCLCPSVGGPGTS